MIVVLSEFVSVTPSVVRIRPDPFSGRTSCKTTKLRFSFKMLISCYINVSCLARLACLWHAGEL